MGDDPQPSPKPQSTQDPNKDTSAAQPMQVAPDNSGVQTGGLKYTENEDGTRDYPDQKPVKTIDDPTPTPEVQAPAAANPEAPSGQ